MAKKLFKKGDTITLFQGGHGNSVVTFKDWVVTSCGTKQATLVRTEDGKNAEFRLYMAYIGEQQNTGYDVVLAGSVDNVAHAAMLRAKLIATMRAHYAQRLTIPAAQGGTEGYKRAIQAAWDKFEAGVAAVGE